MDTRHASPDRVSQATKSEASEKTAQSKETLSVVARAPSEPELLPEEKAGPSELGDLVQQALQDQVTPTLQHMIRHQTLVETRLHMLENETGEDRLATQASLLHLSGDGAADKRDVYTGSSGSAARAGAERVEATQALDIEKSGNASKTAHARKCVDGRNSVRLACVCWRATVTCFSGRAERRARENRDGNSGQRIALKRPQQSGRVAFEASCRSEVRGWTPGS